MFAEWRGRLRRLLGRVAGRIRWLLAAILGAVARGLLEERITRIFALINDWLDAHVSGLALDVLRLGIGVIAVLTTPIWIVAVVLLFVLGHSYWEVRREWKSQAGAIVRAWPEHARVSPRPESVPGGKLHTTYDRYGRHDLFIGSDVSFEATKSDLYPEDRFIECPDCHATVVELVEAPYGACPRCGSARFRTGDVIKRKIAEAKTRPLDSAERPVPDGLTRYMGGVTDALTGEPIAGVLVRPDSEHHYLDVSDGWGRWDLDLPSGRTWPFRFAREAYETAERTGTDAVSKIDVELIRVAR